MPPSDAVQLFIDALAATFPDVGGDCLDPVEARRILAERPELPLPPIDVASVEDTTIPGPAGEVPVRIYTPDGVTDEPAVMVFFHGGGWALCGLDTHDRTTRRLAQELDAVVVSVDYRLAPEARCPAAAEDAYAAAVWAQGHYRPRRLVVAGDSAGGNLSAVVALMARDRGGPDIDHQLLVYPVTDHAMDSPSYTENAAGYFLTRTHMAWYWDQYLGPDGDGSHPYASPCGPRTTGPAPRHGAHRRAGPAAGRGRGLRRRAGSGRNAHRGPARRRPVPRLLRPGRAPARGRGTDGLGLGPAPGRPGLTP